MVDAETTALKNMIEEVNKKLLNFRQENQKRMPDMEGALMTRMKEQQTALQEAGRALRETQGRLNFLNGELDGVDKEQIAEIKSRQTPGFFSSTRMLPSWSSR